MTRLGPWRTAGFQLVLLVSTVACATLWREVTETPLPTPVRPADVAFAASAARPIYNGSVIPGGAYSPDELRAAMDRDPVVAAHYRRAAVGEMRAVTLTAGRAAYVSYRVNDRVYWTRRRVWIRPGETVLTDGVTSVRARCGNCISDTPQGPVAAVDPAHGELEDFVVPPLPDRNLDGAAAEAEPRLGDLLELPFGPQMLAAGPVLPAEFEDGGTRTGGFPGGSLPAVFVPGGGGGSGGGPGGGGQGTTGIPGGTTTGTPESSTTGTPGGTTTSGTTGDATTGTPGGTTGTPDGTTTGISTGTPTDGTPTTGNPFPTTAAVTTVSTSPNPPEAPEPGVMWLLACGAIGFASRRLKQRR